MKFRHKLQNHWTNLPFTNHNRTNKNINTSNNKHNITNHKKVVFDVVQKDTKPKFVTEAEIKNAIAVAS